jgi:hypothetical protein
MAAKWRAFTRLDDGEVDGAEADIGLSLARALVANGEPQRARDVLSLLPQ